MHYVDFAYLTDPARPKSELWRLVVGLVLGVVLYFVGIFVFLPLVAGFSGQSAGDIEHGLTYADTPFWVLVLLFSFVFMGVAAFVVTETLHKRKWQTLFAAPWLEMRLFLRVMFALLLLNVCIVFLPPWGFSLLVENPALAPGTWVLLLPLTLTGILVQTGAEEVVFRGYFQCQLAARFRSPFIWMLVPSLLFGALHYDPTIWGAGALWPAVWAVVFAICAADLTARTGALGPAIAFHFVNNLYAVAFVGFPNELGGLALFHQPFTTHEAATHSPLMITDFALVLTSWLAARIALRR